MARVKTVNEESLVALGDAIRTKTGGEDPLVFPTGMVEAIEGIEAKTPVKPIELTGDCQYICAGPIASAYIQANGDTITTKDITNASRMFLNYQLESIPFEINIKKMTGSYNKVDASYMFHQATKLKSIQDMDFSSEHYADFVSMFDGCLRLERAPHVYNAYPTSFNYLFSSCYRLREVPDDFFDTWNWSRINSYQYTNMGYTFQNCYSLRTPPKAAYDLIRADTMEGRSNSGRPYYSLFHSCYALDEIINLPVTTVALDSSSALNGVCSNCYRLKNFTFETNEDGTPKIARWKNQLLDLSLAANVGSGGSASYYTPYNSGITADKEVRDDAAYQALKNDPDWWTSQRAYSRFDRLSAIATINSLPDTSAYGTNTVKFSATGASKTDGGQANAMTEAEIAVAAAKGWTVAFTT